MNFNFGKPSTGFSTSFSMPSSGFNKPPDNPFGSPNLLSQQTQMQSQQIMQNQSLGLEGQPIEKIQRSYAPFRDGYGRAIASGEGRLNEECEFKSIMYNAKNIVGTNFLIQPDPMLTGSLLEQVYFHF